MKHILYFMITIQKILHLSLQYQQVHGAGIHDKSFKQIARTQSTIQFNVTIVYLVFVIISKTCFGTIYEQT